MDLAEPCQTCGAVLAAGAHFCSACGAGVAEPPAAQRRVVTVVFADLAGFTSLAEGRDPEAVKSLLDRCFSALVPVIARHGGTVDKIIGDELMAVFGAPVAHEDDPERAVRAALGLVDELAGIAPELVLRVGINTGEVLTGPVGPGGASTVTGDAVNTAHRLVSVADPGEILVGERTWAATSETVRYETRPPYELRGKQAPVGAWAAVGVDPTPGRRTPLGLAAPLVGRDLEMDQLRAAATTAFEDGRPTVVVVTGEPGLGKTRLAVDFALRRWQRRNELVLWTTCPAYGASGGLEPLADLMRTALDVDPADDRGTQLDALSSALAPVAAAVGGDHALLGARLAQLLGLHDLPQRASEPDPGPTRARVVDQLVAAAHTVLEGMARTRPVIAVVDDVQWADDAVLGFLERLPSRVGPAPLLVLALGRDEVLERRGGLGRGRAGIVSVPLTPLGPEPAGRLLRDLLAATTELVRPATAPAPEVGPQLEQRILDAAGGNPLLLEQLVRYLTERGALAEVDGRWQGTTDFERLGLPDGIRSLIGARLDSLPGAERAAVQLAAVFGRRFWVDGIATLADGERPEAAVASLAARGIVESVADDDRPGDYAFRHVLTRDVAYAAIPISERADQHAAVARWLRHRFPSETDGPLAGLLAHHYERAVVLSRELERTDPGLAGAAYTALVRAAREAERHDALREAEQWYTRARELGTFDPQAALEVTLAHGVVLANLRRFEDARAAFELVRRRAGAADVVPPRPDLGRTATAWQAATARLSGDGDTARDLFEEAQKAWGEAGDLAGEADTLRLQGWSELTAGRARAAQPRLRRAADLERQAGVGPRGETLEALGWSEFLVGDTNAAQEHLWAAAAHHFAAGDPGAVAWCFGILCFTFLQLGRLRQAAEGATALLEHARVEGDPWSEATCTVLLAVCVTYQGDVVEGERLAIEAVRRFDELGDAWGSVMSRLVLGTAARLRGDHTTARRHLLDGLATSQRATYVGEDARLLAELALVEADAGDDEGAMRRGRAALAMVRAGIGDHDTGLRALLVLAELSRRAGDLAGAQLLLEEAVGLSGEGPPTDTWRQANAALAAVLVARGDPAAAAGHTSLAADGTGEGVRVAVAVARAEAAVAVAEGDPVRAVSALTDVVRRFDHWPLAVLDPVRDDLERLRPA